MSTIKCTRAKRDREGARMVDRAAKLAKKDARRAMRSAGVFDLDPETTDDHTSDQLPHNATTQGIF